MSDTTALAPIDFDQLPSTQIGTDDQFADLAKGGDYIGRMQLYTKSKANLKGLIPQGHYGIPESDEEIVDLGESVDLLPLARRPKAIDMTDMEALVISYDMESEEFKRIAAQSAETDSHRQYGPELLDFRAFDRPLSPGVLLRQQIESPRVGEDFPLPAAQSGRHRRQGGGRQFGRRSEAPRPDAYHLEGQGGRESQGNLARPRRGEVLHAVHPVAFRRSASAAEIAKFLAVKDNGVEKVQDSKPGRAR